MAEYIKATLATAITDLRRDIQTMTVRMGEIEESATIHDTAIQQLQASYHSQNTQIRDIQRHMEDLDNHGHRHNIRVGDIPETIENNQIAKATIAIFNDLLGRHPESPIEHERLHRALKPRKTDPPEMLSAVSLTLS